MKPALKVLDLFSGIGGFSLGLEQTDGFETVAFCEIEPSPRAVLAKHWPETPCYDDVRTLAATRLASDGIGGVDVITGGFPCQDISIAGNKAGIVDGSRSGLWSEIARLVCELRPSYIIVENVANLLAGPTEQPGAWFGRVLGDLAERGYDAEWRVIRGYEVGVPQARTRVWLVAYPSRSSGVSVLHTDAFDAFCHQARLHGFGGGDADANNESRGPRALPVLGNALWSEIPHRERSGSNERLSVGLDRYKGLGNTVIPAIPYVIGRAILADLEAA